MCILLDALSIFFGATLGSLLKKRLTLKYNIVLGISIMLVSIVGIIENLFIVSENQLTGSNLIPVVFSLIIGTSIGEVVKINSITGLSKDNAFLTGCMFFGIGGLQISGPVLWLLNNDSSQLVLKSIIDFPFAVVLGATLGKGVAGSSIPVVVVQIIIAGIAYISRTIISNNAIEQICSLGYIILFFTGFNLIVKERYRIETLNMLPSMILVVLYSAISSLFGGKI